MGPDLGRAKKNQKWKMKNEKKGLSQLFRSLPELCFSLGRKGQVGRGH